MYPAQIELAALEFLRKHGHADAGLVGIEGADPSGRYLCSYDLGGVAAVGRRMVAVDPESGVCEWATRRIINIV